MHGATGDFAKSLLENLYFSLHQAVRGWMIGSYADVANSIHLTELAKFFCHKLWAIVQNYTLNNAESCKQLP